ncbi:RNA-binding cell elongation regulator Jag/EloR [Enterococcus timonensis]|uniref:RNA-binding cell elongation regulator Jag/EloR n=1 Tax=Enterococcus timonensis TaxID=1852364 RepID=UPI0008D90AB9|nr:RNA-binding cell elongation regulator Jag/EloR [Enterococcus timonensis]
MPKFTGENVELALASALKSLQVEKNQVTIHILDPGKKGFLGIGKKDAILEVSLIEEATPKQTSTAVKKTVEEKNAGEEKNIVATEKSADSTLAPDSTPVKTATDENLPEENQNDEDIDALFAETGEYLVEIVKQLGAPSEVTIEKKRDAIIFHLETEKQGIVIGKHGKVLNALQYLAQVYLHRNVKGKISVIVNVGDYRQRRQVILERLAYRTADQVKRTKMPVILEPMPAFERKQIHAILNKNQYVKTHSEGNEPYRYLVVEPSDKKIF